MCEIYEFLGWWTFVGWFLFAIFWVGIIALVIWIIRRNTDRSSYKISLLSLDIAKQRYARGEISRDEFEQMKKDLS